MFSQELYQEKVKLFKSVCEQLGRTLRVKDLENNKWDLPSRKWFAKHCPDPNVNTYSDFLKWIGYEVFRPEKVSKKRKYSFEIAYQEFSSRGFILLEQEYVNSIIPLKFLCPKHPGIIQTKSINSLIHGNSKCKYCVNSYHNRGESNPMWKGGTSKLNLYLREFIGDWKNESMISCDYKCVITGKRFDVIHHLYSFNKILTETLDELNLPINQNIKGYTQDQLDVMKIKIIEKHAEYPLGVCLCNEVHNLYHNLYGDDNTPEQFEEFKQRYFSGEFLINNAV